jgi:hypothetical protein
MLKNKTNNKMWATDSLWFEIAIVSAIYALGNITFGHFEEQTPKIRRTSKYILTIVIVCMLSIYFGRTVAMMVLGLFFLPILYIHGYYLPKKKGINGWTGEPKSKYYEFRGWNTDIFKEKKRNKKGFRQLLKQWRFQTHTYIHIRNDWLCLNGLIFAVTESEPDVTLVCFYSRCKQCLCLQINCLPLEKK